MATICLAAKKKFVALQPMLTKCPASSGARNAVELTAGAAERTLKFQSISVFAAPVFHVLYQ